MVHHSVCITIHSQTDRCAVRLRRHCRLLYRQLVQSTERIYGASILCSDARRSHIVAVHHALPFWSDVATKPVAFIHCASAMISLVFSSLVIASLVIFRHWSGASIGLVRSRHLANRSYDFFGSIRVSITCSSLSFQNRIRYISAKGIPSLIELKLERRQNT